MKLNKTKTIIFVTHSDVGYSNYFIMNYNSYFDKIITVNNYTIDKLLNDYVELNNVKMLKNLFIDINMLLKLNYISKELIKETLETYDDILLSDYFNEMKILNF